MLASRFAFLVYAVIYILLNGWGLLALWDVLPSFGVGPAVIYIFNLVTVPVAIWAAYRTGELAEDEFRRKAAASAAKAQTPPEQSAEHTEQNGA